MTNPLSPQKPPMPAEEYFRRIGKEAMGIGAAAPYARDSSGAMAGFGERLERFANFITYWPAADDPRYK